MSAKEGEPARKKGTKDWAKIDAKNKFQIGNVIDRQTAAATAAASKCN